MLQKVGVTSFTCYIKIKEQSKKKKATLVCEIFVAELITIMVKKAVASRQFKMEGE